MPNKYMLTIPWHANIFVYWLTTYRLSELNFLFILKVANIRCFILINCSCIFHNIIVNTRSLERRKYIAVWFSSIQKRIQCWPTQYSYDLTVNSFGKAFAHVRNCLLMKNMSDVHKSNHGRTKTLMDSTRKWHKKEDSASFV